MVTTTTHGGQRVTICMCTQTGRHLATFTRQHGSSLYKLATEPPQVAASVQVSASVQVAAPCSSLPLLPPSPAPPCLPCVEGRQCAAPHSSSFPPTTAPLQTLHMDMWGPARVSGQSHERYFLLTISSSASVSARTNLSCVCTLTEVVSSPPTSCGNFFHGEGILQSFMLSDSPQQNGIAEHRIGLVMEVARTSMIHAAAPHFLWPFAVRYAAHQLNLWPRVSLPETSPTLRWTGEVGDASVFRVWGSRAFVRDMSAEKLSPRAIPCGPAPSGVSQVDPLPGPARVQVAIGSGAARGAASGCAESGGAEPGGAESEGAESGGGELGGEETGGAEPVGVEPEGAESGGA
ncbi:unnamed protein product [Closterium sp. NIES-54]